MTRLIIDCDPGHDDAMAILYAARHLNLIALTTVFGTPACRTPPAMRWQSARWPAWTFRWPPA